MYIELLNSVSNIDPTFFSANIGAGILKIINQFTTAAQAILSAVLVLLGTFALFMAVYWAYRKVTTDQQQRAQYSWWYAFLALVIGGLMVFGGMNWVLKLAKSAQASFGNLGTIIDPALVEGVSRTFA